MIIQTLTAILEGPQTSLTHAERTAILRKLTDIRAVLQLIGTMIDFFSAGTPGNGLRARQLGVQARRFRTKVSKRSGAFLKKSTKKLFSPKALRRSPVRIGGRLDRPP